MWAMMCWELCRDGEYLMALYVIWMLVCYMRPSEPLRILVKDLQRPVANISQHWQLSLFPEERPARSKTYASNDSIELSCG